MSADEDTGRFQRRMYTHSVDRSYPYGLYIPSGQQSDRPWPLILFLHGIGECGTDGLRHLKGGLPAAIWRQPAKWPFVVVAPQKPERTEEWELHAEALFGLLDRVAQECSIDPDRVHVTGLSQGGHGAWALGAEQPERWASIVPICGYAAGPVGGWASLDPDRAWTAARAKTSVDRIASAVQSVPVWAFHGSADRVVPVDLTEHLVEAMRARGANCRSTIYDGIDHNAWDRAYAEDELAGFMQEARRSDRDDPRLRG